MSSSCLFFPQYIQFITLDKEKKKIPSISNLELGKMTLRINQLSK